jgi:nucleoid DNA-binding protein
MITKHLKKGERVKIAGLGILQVRESGCPHGPQSDDRRADPDQGE